MLDRLTLEIHPSFAIGYYNQGMAWKQLGRLDEAIALHEQHNPVAKMDFHCPSDQLFDFTK